MKIYLVHFVNGVTVKVVAAHLNYTTDGALILLQKEDTETVAVFTSAQIIGIVEEASSVR